MIDKLLKAGADANELGPQGETPLMLASRSVRMRFTTDQAPAALRGGPPACAAPPVGASGREPVPVVLDI